MNLIKKLLGIVCALWLVSPAYADNSCGILHVEIKNSLPDECVLSYDKLIHGSLNGKVATVIAPNETKSFDIVQTPYAYGPEILLYFQCGKEYVGISSQQNFCLIETGDISGKVVPPSSNNIQASYTALPGSLFWGKSGAIFWNLLPVAS